MSKDKLTIFVDRLKRIGIDIECAGNIPWIYLNKVNGKQSKRWQVNTQRKYQNLSGLLAA